VTTSRVYATRSRSISRPPGSRPRSGSISTRWMASFATSRGTACRPG